MNLSRSETVQTGLNNLRFLVMLELYEVIFYFVRYDIILTSLELDAMFLYFDANLRKIQLNCSEFRADVDLNLQSVSTYLDSSVGP